MCRELGIEIEEDVLRRLAFGFAGGIGSTGATCGAVVGGVMALGLELGRAETMEEGLRRLAVSREFRRRFEAEMKDITCRGLTGMDMSTMSGREEYMNSEVPQTVCFPAVGVAYRLVLDLLDEAKQP